MTSNGIWEGGWVQDSTGTIRYVQDFQVSLNPGNGCGCGCGSGSGSGSGNSGCGGCGSGSGSGSSMDSGHPISYGDCMAGTIKNGAGEVHLNWTSGNTTGITGLSQINTYITFIDPSFSLEESNIQTTWVNAYEAKVLGTFSYRRDGKLRECHICGGSFTIPSEYHL